jgi:hypothetical protein
MSLTFLVPVSGSYISNIFGSLFVGLISERFIWMLSALLIIPAGGKPKRSQIESRTGGVNSLEQLVHALRA